MTERTEPGIYAALPDGAAGTMPWVLACHGSGRCAQSVSYTHLELFFPDLHPVRRLYAQPVSQALFLKAA